MALINDTRRLRDLDPGFLNRYNLSGPRYTSYPTAPEWSERVGAENVRQRLTASREASANQPLSIYVHIPFCLERCAFCACNVIVSRQKERVCDPYLDLLEAEAARWAELLDPRRPVVQLHLGGGTPTYLNAAQLTRLHRMITRHFHLAEDAEQSLEAHVTWTSDEQVRVLAELGFDRLSLGVQDFNERTREASGRNQSPERTRQLIETARVAGFRGVNLDLIYGLPYQTARSFNETIEQTLDLRPDRLALYNFAYLPQKLANQRPIDPAALPTADEKIKIFLQAHDRFTEAGYRYIGMDHFALPGDELARAFDEGTMRRNFMGFTTRAGSDLLGLGVSAISSFGDLYAQNTKKLSACRRALDAGRLPTERGLTLSRDDLIRREVINGLMCRDHVDKRRIEEQFNIEFDLYFWSELDRLKPLVRDELLVVNEHALDLTFLGRLFARNIAMIFDGYLNRPRIGKGPVIYSKTV